MKKENERNEDGIKKGRHEERKGTRKKEKQTERKQEGRMEEIIYVKERNEVERKKGG